MSGVTPLRAASSRVPAQPPELTASEAVALAVPLCFVVDPDPLWADHAVDFLLSEYAAQPNAPRDREQTVARWTRTRRWSSYTPNAFGLGGGETPPGDADVLEEVVRLSEHLGSARRGEGVHPFQGALFSIRGLQPDLARPHAPDVLLDVVRQLSGCGATLLVELDSAPAPHSLVMRLGPVVALPADPGLRYEHALAELARLLPSGAEHLRDGRALAGALEGLSRLQAELVARLVCAAAGATGRGGDFLHLISNARARVEAAMPGVAG